MRISLEQLREQRALVTRTDIRSIEGKHYMAVIHMGDSQRILSNHQDETLMLPSVAAMNELLDEQGITNRMLVHDSPYNEMIGLDEVGVDPLRIATGEHR